MRRVHNGKNALIISHWTSVKSVGHAARRIMHPCMPKDSKFLIHQQFKACVKSQMVSLVCRPADHGVDSHKTHGDECVYGWALGSVIRGNRLTVQSPGGGKLLAAARRCLHFASVLRNSSDFCPIDDRSPFSPYAGEDSTPPYAATCHNARRKHIMPRIFLPIALQLCVLSGAAADELAVVTAETGYLLNDNNETVDTVSLFQPLDIKGEAGEYILVQIGDQSLRIHSGVVHRTSHFDHYDQKTISALREVFDLLHESNKLYDSGKNEDAVRKADEAATDVLEKLGKSTTWEMWARQFQAYLLLQSGDIQRAKKVAKECVELMEKLDARESLHAADVFNILAMLRGAEENWEAAISAYRQATLIVLKELSLLHHDVAVIRMNHAEAQQANGDLPQAIQLQKLALLTFSKILPPSAKVFPENWQRLGQFQRDYEDHQSAIESFRTAIGLFSKHHPTLLSELANVNTDLIYSHTQMEDFVLAESTCLSNLIVALQLSDREKRYYERDVALRQGNIDFAQSNFQAALKHYQDAAFLADIKNCEVDDGIARESIGDVFLELGKIEDAVKAYEQAIEHYAISVGSESDEVLNLRDYVYAHADIPYEASGAYCVVAMPEGILTDENGKFISTVPGLTVLPLVATEEDSAVVKYNEKTAYVTNSQLYTQRNIPGYGVVSQDVAVAVLKATAESLDALEQQDVDAAEESIQSAIDLCSAEVQEDCSILAWLKVMQAGILMHTRGIESARTSLLAVQRDVEALNANSYPLILDFTQAQAAILVQENKHAEAISLLDPILQQTQDHFGENHAMVVSLRRTLGINNFKANQHDQAVTHLQNSMRIAREIYPDDSDPVGKAVSDYAILLTQIERYKQSAQTLKNYLDDVRQPAKAHHAMLVGTLGKAYARLDKKADARELLKTVLSVQSDEASSVIENPAGLLAYSELGRLDLAEDNWKEAAEQFQNAILSAKAQGMGDLFEVSEFHKQRAEALIELGKKADAAIELNEVLRIYGVLGGGGSPQAEAIQEQLLGMQATNSEPATDSVLQELGKLFNFTPAGQSMYQLTESVSALSQPNSAAESIAQLETGEDIWSLESENGFHRIYVADEQEYGWVPEEKLALRVTNIREKGKEKLAEKLSTSDVKVCVEAFDTAMSLNSETADEQIDELEKAIKTIESRMRYQALSGFLREKLVAAYRQKGDLESLDRIASDSLTASLASHGYHHPFVASLRVAVAENSQLLGDDFKAHNEIRDATKICERCFGPNDPRVLALRIRHAGAKLRTGDFATAEEAYIELSKVEGEDPRSVLIRSSATMGLGLIRATEREYAAAAEQLEQALDGFSSLQHPSSVLTIQSAIALAYSVSHLGETEEALQILERVADMAVPPADANTKLSHLTLMARLAAPFDVERALRISEEAIRFANEHFGDGGILVSDAWYARGIAQAMVPDRQAAVQSFDLARKFATAYSQNNVAFLSLNQQLSYLSEDSRRLDDALRLAVGAKDQKVIEASAEWLINGHHLGTDVLHQVSRVRGRLNGSSNSSLSLWEYLRKDVAQISQKILHKPSQHLADQIEAMKVDVKSNIARLPAEARSIASGQPNWITIDEVRSGLFQHEVLVLFRKLKNPNRYEDSINYQLRDDHQQEVYVAWVVPATDMGNVCVVTLDRSQSIDANVAQLNSLLFDVASNTSAKAQLPNASESETDLLKKLSVQIWKPISRCLPGGTSQLAMVADGTVHGVPWLALPDVGGDAIVDRYDVRQIANPRDIFPFVDDFAFSNPVIFSQSDRLSGDNQTLRSIPKDQLKALNSRARGSKLPFDKVAMHKAVRPRESIVDELFGIIGARRNGNQKNTNNEDAPSEVELAYGSLFEKKAQRLAGTQSSELQFFTLNRPEALHFETATFVNKPQSVELTAEFVSSEARALIARGGPAFISPLTQSGLVMAGISIEDSKHHLNDGVLTGEEISTQDLRGTKLVTLAVAPRTIDGRPTPPEASMLLARPFRAAGALSVVSGLWPRDPAHADTVLKGFYQSLKEGRRASEALRMAQLEVREQNQGKVSAAFWAAFHITGHDVQLAERQRQRDTQPTTPKPDKTDEELKTLAQDILSAYRTKDVSKVLAFTSAGPLPARVLQSFKPGTSRYESLFGEESWRWQAVAAWNHQFSAVYYTQNRKPVEKSQATEAHVEFGRDGSEVFVVTLTKTDGVWRFDDIHSPDASDLGVK